MVSLKKATVAGISWALAASVSRQGLQFIFSVLLARHLAPQDYGLLGMGLIFTGFASLFGSLGYGFALVQHRDVTERHLSSVFWLTLLAGGVIGSLIAASGPVLAWVYGEPKLPRLMILIAPNFWFNSLRVVPNAILTRALRFRAIAVAETISVVGSGLVALTLVARGWGVDALVAQLLTLNGLTAAATFIASRWRPQVLFDTSAVRDLSSFSINLLGHNSFDYWMQHADNFLVAKFSGTAQLGIYARAYNIMVLPMQQVSAVLGRVMLPALVSVRDDYERFIRIYLALCRIVAFVTVPAMLGLIVVASPFVTALFGPRWTDVALTLQVLCVPGLLIPVGSTVGLIYQSYGRTDLMLRWGALSGTIMFGAFAIGATRGAVGVASSYAIVSMALFYHSIAIPARLVGLRFRNFVANLLGIVSCGAVMFSSTIGFRLLLRDRPGPWLDLLLTSSLGLAIYVTLAHVFHLRAYRELRELLRDRLHQRRVPAGPSPSG